MSRNSKDTRKYRGPSRPIDPRNIPVAGNQKKRDTFGIALVGIGMAGVLVLFLLASLLQRGNSTAGTTAGTTLDPAAATVVAATQVAIGFATQTASLANISPAEAIAASTSGAKIIDVRAANQYQASHIKGSTNIPYTDVQSHLTEIPNTGSVILYCQ